MRRDLRYIKGFSAEARYHDAVRHEADHGDSQTFQDR